MTVMAAINWDWLADKSGYILAGLIVLVGVAIGLPDLLRLSPRRIWAIGSVGFRESMRRRVLWVTPLAMLGVVAVTQLSHPIDEQDAIRQATKYCLFASGLVVVIATLILACTNLPKEIDNRVIYTIVTKPATRLEIVLGKTVAFACTSAVMLLVMGLFSYVYLHVNEAQLASSVQGRLKALPPGDPGRQTLQHYADDGLLQSRTYVRPPQAAWGERPMLQIYAPPLIPAPGGGFRWRTEADPPARPSGDDPVQWAFGAEEQNVLFPFRLPDWAVDQPSASLQISIDAEAYQRATLNRRETEQERPEPGTPRPTTKGAPVPPARPKVTVSLLDADGFEAASPGDLMDVRHPLEDKKLTARGDFRNANLIPLEPPGPASPKQALIVVSEKGMDRLRQLPRDPSGSRRLYVMVIGTTLATKYGFRPDSVKVTALGMADGKKFEHPLPQADAAGRPFDPVFRGRAGTSQSLQLRGDPDPTDAPFAVYQFRDAAADPGAAADVEFEFRTRIERGGADRSEAENVTTLDVVVYNRKTGYASPTIRITPDSDRATLFRVPAEAVKGGDFDVVAQGHTQGHYVGVRPAWLGMVASKQTFAGNLLKSLTILWLLSVLVVVISIFCSTFLSWPIAIVLALVMLLGRWCVTQMGELASPGQMAVELFGQSGSGAAGARVFTDTMRVLNQMLAVLSKVLPDLDQFRVTADIERGVTIPYRNLLDPLSVLVGYGVPILFLSYLFLRKKEVAP